MKTNKKHIWTRLGVIAMITLLSGCFPDEFANNGLQETDLDPSFTISPVDGSPNRFILSANATNYIATQWDLGDGAVYTGQSTEEVFLPDAGDYTITHYAIGRGGYKESASLPLNVATSDPNSGNIVVGGKLDTPDDIASWTVLTISASGTAWSFAGGKATVTGGGWNQQGFYQAINVIKDKTYKIEMLCASTTGVSNTWFEVYCSPVEPVQNNDYSGTVYRNINTWDGCALTPFSGKISAVGCNDDKNGGTFTATESGVLYLVIKCGGEDLKGGISVDNIEVRAQQ